MKDITNNPIKEGDELVLVRTKTQEVIWAYNGIVTKSEGDYFVKNGALLLDIREDCKILKGNIIELKEYIKEDYQGWKIVPSNYIVSSNVLWLSPELEWPLYSMVLQS